MKYTPGPWKVRANDNCKQIFAANREKVACTSGLWDDEEDLGNALLISAAPDMYEMLKEVVDTLELVDPGVYTGTINQIKTVLAMRRASRPRKGLGEKQWNQKSKLLL